MWMTWIMAALIAIAGCLALGDQVRSPPTAAYQSADLADSMSVYRSAVITYVKDHPTMRDGAVLNDSLTLPSWYKPYPSWRNHVGADGITIYADTQLPMNITPDLMRLTLNSASVGVAEQPANMFRSLLYPEKPLPLPAGLPIPIPNGSPVWLARRN